MITENKFEWTDELVKDFVRENFNCNELNYLPHAIWQFKNRKQQNTIQKDWEIISVEDGVKNGSYSKGKIVFIESEDERSWIKSNIKIHSVKRLSDGEIFSVGDIIEIGFANIDKGSIDRFEINYFDNSEISAWHSVFGKVIKHLKKVKQPLLKTEDGVDVYEGDRYYVVIEKEGFGYEPFSVAWCGEGEIKSANYKNAAKFFSDKEKANEYILLNKPLLSVNDIMKAAPLMGKYYEDGIKGLAKQKIEGK